MSDSLGITASQMRPWSEQSRVKRLIGRPQEALLCAKAKHQRQMFSVAKAKRQIQSTQSERRSTPRFEKGLYFLICHLDFLDIIVFQQHEKTRSTYTSGFLQYY